MGRLRKPGARRGHPLLAAVTLAMPLALGSVLAAPLPAGALTAPPGDAFYVPPSPLPPGQPGDIIWSRMSASPVAGAQAWQILYLSTTVAGSPAAISGTLIVPAAPYPRT